MPLIYIIEFQFIVYPLIICQVTLDMHVLSYNRYIYCAIKVSIKIQITVSGYLIKAEVKIRHITTCIVRTE